MERITIDRAEKLKKLTEGIVKAELKQGNDEDYFDFKWRKRDRCRNREHFE